MLHHGEDGILEALQTRRAAAGFSACVITLHGSVPVLAAIQEGSGLDREKTKEVFLTVALFAHGYASIIANNALAYDEKLIAQHLERAWNGAFLAATQEEEQQ